MESRRQAFRGTLDAKGLKIGTEYVLNGTIAHALQWGDKGIDQLQKRIAQVLKPVKDSIYGIPGFKKGSRYGPGRASLETIMTKIFPLFVPQYPTLQYYVDMWKVVEYDEAAYFPESTAQHFTLHAETSHPCIIRRDQDLVILAIPYSFMFDFSLIQFQIGKRALESVTSGTHCF